MTQFVTRVDDRLVAAVDRLVAEGAVASRSEAVRQGLEALIEQHRRRAVAASIIEGYQRRPQAASEVGWADAATRRMITEEPW